MAKPAEMRRTPFNNAPKRAPIRHTSAAASHWWAGDRELDGGITLEPLALAIVFVFAVLIALHCDRVERCESTPCDFGRPTWLDGECTCTAPAQ